MMAIRYESNGRYSVSLSKSGGKSLVAFNVPRLFVLKELRHVTKTHYPNLVKTHVEPGVYGKGFEEVRQKLFE
jgi:hypothetical protein